MIGDTFSTKHFGIYKENRDTDKPAKEFVGKVIVRAPRNGKGPTHAYLFVGDKDNTVRYDLPAFMRSYDKHQVALLGREYQKKTSTGKVYDKLVVITVKDLGDRCNTRR